MYGQLSTSCSNTEVAQYGPPNCSRPQSATDSGVRDDIYIDIYTLYQPVVELVEWRTEESEVSGSNSRARFQLLKHKPVLYHEWSGMVGSHALYR